MILNFYFLTLQNRTTSLDFVNFSYFKMVIKKEVRFFVIFFDKNRTFLLDFYWKNLIKN